MWPIQLAFLPFIVRGISLPFLTLCNIYFSVQLIFSILSHHYVSKLFQTQCSWPTFQTQCFWPTFQTQCFWPTFQTQWFWPTFHTQCFWPTFRSIQVSIPYTALLHMQHCDCIFLKLKQSERSSSCWTYSTWIATFTFYNSARIYHIVFSR
jgi:hypothetical protein